MPRKRMELKVTEDTYNFFESRKAKTGETFSEIIDKIVIQHQRQSEDFMEQMANTIIDKLQPNFNKLRTIDNENNRLIKTNFEILNYILMTESYTEDFNTMCKDTKHLATISAEKKIKSQINYQRLIALENEEQKQKKGVI